MSQERLFSAAAVLRRRTPAGPQAMGSLYCHSLYSPRDLVVVLRTVAAGRILTAVAAGILAVVLGAVTARAVLAAVAAGRILAGILVAVLTVLVVIHVFVIVLHGSTS